MPHDPIFPGHEDLYEPSKIYLFGKPFKGLRYVRNDLARSKYDTPPSGERLDMPPGVTEETLIRDRFSNESERLSLSPIEKTVVVQTGEDKNGSPIFEKYTGILKEATISTKDEEGNDITKTGNLEEAYTIDANTRLTPQLARIYSFSFGGHYYKLPCPLIYLVWGPGQNPVDDDQTAGLPQFQTLNTGLEGKGWRFASDIRVWKMDKNDQSMVIDLEIGDLEDILLEPAFLTYEAGGAIDSRMTAASRMTAVSRMTAASRMTAVSRMTAASRMTAVSRMTMTGPHQD